MSRWLEDVQAVGRADADAVFTDERLERQRESVMDRLAELDRPSKVISFPAASLSERQALPRRRLNAGWLAAAAAAGLMIGVISVELSHMIPGRNTPVPTAAVVNTPTTVNEDFGFLDATYDRPSLSAIQDLDDMTPRVADVVLASNTSNR
jgi:hypothetical protein